MYWLWVVWTSGSNIAAAVCCLWAFWRGGMVERIGAGMIGLAWSLTVLVKDPNMGPNLAIVWIDIALLVGLVALALWSRRIWVFFAAACALNAVFSHFAKYFTDFGLYSYASAAGFWGGWALLVCLAAGILGYRHTYSKLQRAARSTIS